MNTARYLAAGALLIATLGCRDETTSPNDPAGSPTLQTNASATAALTFRQVSAGNLHSCGETTGNRAYCWGLNSFGKLGDGSTTRRLSPSPGAGGLFFAQLSAGGHHTCGRTPAGEGYCWGYGFFGQLGNGTSSSGAEAHTPSRIIEPI
jgi:alpha-tubulin suppressor-like RCC1 family protein